MEVIGRGAFGMTYHNADGMFFDCSGCGATWKLESGDTVGTPCPDCHRHCNHSATTWKQVGGLWDWECPECGRVDGFTGEVK